MSATPQAVVTAGRSGVFNPGNVSRPAQPRKPMPASRQFLLGLAIAVVTLVLFPWCAMGTTLWPNVIRVGLFLGCVLTLWTWMVAVGVGVSGQRMGVLWSSRNTYSLSRLQIVMWTLLVLSALAAVVVSRAFGLFADGGTGGFSSALNIHIPGELLAVMGISVASGAAAPAILSLKSQAAPPSEAQLVRATQRVGGDVEAAGGVAIRPENCPPLVKDIFQSDDIANAGCVDIGKVQQAVVTLILWLVYLGMLIVMFWSGEAPPPTPLPKGWVPHGSALPAMSDGFVYLLGISHAGYLAYKAAPSPTGGTDSAATSASTTTTPRPQPPQML